MKKTCKVLASVCAAFALIPLMMAFANHAFFIYAITLFGWAFTLGIASVIIDRLDQSIIATYRRSNPRKVAALDLSFIFLIDEIKSEYEPRIDECSGTVYETARNTFSVNNVKYEQDNEYTVKDYSYKCTMHYKGGDVYDANNWTCENIKIYNE